MTWTLPTAVLAMLYAPAPSASPAPPPSAAAPAASPAPAPAGETAAAAEQPATPVQAPAPHEAEPSATAEPAPVVATEAAASPAEPPPAILPEYGEDEDPLGDADATRVPKPAKFDGKPLWVAGAAVTGVVFLTQLAAHQLLRSSCEEDTDDLLNDAAACAGDMALYLSARTAGLVAYQAGIALMATGGAFSGRARAMNHARREADALPALRRPLGMGLAIGGGVGAVASVLAWSWSIDGCSTPECAYRADLITTITLGASMASVSTGAMLWAQSSAYRRKAGELRISPTANRQGGGLSVAGRF